MTASIVPGGQEIVTTPLKTSRKILTMVHCVRKSMLRFTMLPMKGGKLVEPLRGRISRSMSQAI